MSDSDWQLQQGERSKPHQWLISSLVGQTSQGETIYKSPNPNLKINCLVLAPRKVKKKKSRSKSRDENHWSLINSMVNTWNILWVNAKTYLRKKSRNGKLPRTVATSSISSQCSSLSSLLVSAGSVAHIAILTGIINMKKVTPGSSNAFVGAFICGKCQW